MSFAPLAFKFLALGLIPRPNAQLDGLKPSSVPCHFERIPGTIRHHLQSDCPISLSPNRLNPQTDRHCAHQKIKYILEEMNAEKKVTITRVQFNNFKAFQRFSIRIRDINVLVGPNNSGKSTILNAFRVLAAGIKRANAKSATTVPGPEGDTYGHYVSVDELPISFENVHTNYETDKASTITFTLSNGNSLRLYFPEARECVLIPNTVSRSARTPSIFRREFPISIEFVPVLGPLEHEEQRVEERTVQRNLITHRASRNFRNYWRYNFDYFDKFAQLLSSTWQGMKILPPEAVGLDTLVMFCEENGILRELYWAGFGFQVWCQLLTHVVRSHEADFLIVDEPEIYLHPDLQRQLLALLRSAGPKVILATHSTEVIAEADPDEILVVDKSARSAKRLKNIDQVQGAIEYLGSIQNITLTQLARTRRVLFVEGTDFKLLGQYARILELPRVANQSNFTVVPTEGFSHWPKLQAFQWGFEKTMGQKLSLGAVFDRDYRCDEHISKITNDLSNSLEIVHFHQRKELENYLLVPVVLEKAIQKRYRSANGSLDGLETIEILLETITVPLKADVQAQYINERVKYFKKSPKSDATTTSEAIKIFEQKWTDIASRMEIVPGKKTFSDLNSYLQRIYGISITPSAVVREFSKLNVPRDLVRFLRQVDRVFCQPIDNTVDKE